MLLSLHISNYALISEIDIDFAAGLNIITGETGAGKSIILGALGLLLGGRADMRVVRDPARKTVVEAIFSVGENPALATALAEADIDNSPTCIIRREILPSGARSRAFVNDTPVNLSLLQQISPLLVDIHSQHQNRLLSEPAYQLSLLDGIAGNKSLLDDYAHAFKSYRAALKSFVDTRNMIERKKADTEFITYQLDRLNELQLQPGEQAHLEQQRRVLADVTNVKTHLQRAVDALSARQDSASDLISVAIDSTNALDELIPDALSLAERLNTALIEVADIADTLATHNSRLAADPAQLEYIEERLGKIYSLESRYNVESSDDLIALRNNLTIQLQALNNSDETLAALEAKAREAKKSAMLIARKISEARASAAVQLQQMLCERARPLGLPNLQCRIDISQSKLTATGIDNVDFLFAFNKNQQPMPVGAGASGGEMSRLVFTVKSIMASIMQMPTIIFDEVDTGISGDIANRMGAIMQQMAQSIQVIVITHLPQIAAKGNTHYKVYKIDDANSTNTHIRVLQPQERVAELALMLSGDPDDDTARATAQSLINAAAMAH